MEQFITQYWTQIVTLVGVVWGYARLNNKVSNNENRINKIEDEIDIMNPVLIDIRERLARIETKLEELTR